MYRRNEDLKKKLPRTERVKIIIIINHTVFDKIN